MLQQPKSPSCQSDSTCDSKQNKKTCKHLQCPKLQKKCTLESKICQELLKKHQAQTKALLCAEKTDTCAPFEPTDKEEPARSNFVFNRDYLQLDAFGFGMTNCCLQITFSSRNIAEARHVYDSLSVVSPLMAAFSASTAVVDSVLIDWDVRMRLIEQSTDSRSRAEHVRLLSA